MTVEQVLQLLVSAMRSEQQFMDEFLHRGELLSAAESQARFRALDAFRHLLLANLALEEGDSEQ